MKYFLTLDIGTTAVKACVFNSDFQLSGSSNKEYELLTPEQNIVELDPEVYWQNSVFCIKEAVALSGVNAAEIGVITVTTQGETLIPVDMSGRSLRNAIVWLDTRAEQESRFISDRFTDDELFEKTGVTEMSPMWPACKILWIKNNEPGVYDQTYKFMLVEDFIILRLTGKYVTEGSVMSSTCYYDINDGALWLDMLSHIGVGPEKIPDILECGAVVSEILPEAAKRIGLSASCLVSTGAMDQAAAAIGACNVSKGVVSETTGTALVVAATVDQHHPQGQVPVNIIECCNLHHSSSFSRCLFEHVPTP